jgi:hypothetical protein
VSAQRVDGVRKYVRSKVTVTHQTVATVRLRVDGAKCVARVPSGAQATEVEAWVSTPLPRETSGPGIPTLTEQSAPPGVETSGVSTPFGGSRRFAGCNGSHRPCLRARESG